MSWPESALPLHRQFPVLRSPQSFDALRRQGSERSTQSTLPHGPVEQFLLGKLFQIISDRLRRYSEVRRKIHNANPAGLACEIHDFLLTRLLHQSFASQFRSTVLLFLQNRWQFPTTPTTAGIPTR